MTLFLLCSYTHEWKQIATSNIFANTFLYLLKFQIFYCVCWCDNVNKWFLLTFTIVSRKFDCFVLKNEFCNTLDKHFIIRISHLSVLYSKLSSKYHFHNQVPLPTCNMIHRLAQIVNNPNSSYKLIAFIHLIAIIF